MPCVKDPRSSSAPLPPYSVFHDPLIKVMARRTRFRSGVSVTCGPVILDTLREAGYDPDNLPHGWPLKGRKGIARRVREQFRYAHRDWTYPTMASTAPGRWKLTEAGLFRAYVLYCDGTRNLTATYLDLRLRGTGGLEGSFMTLMRAAILKKLSRSATAGFTEDHIHNCFVRLIHRDSLRERILQGRGFPDTLIASYMVRSGYSDIRKMGVEPVCREMYGARTEREVVNKIEMGELTDSRIIWGDDGFGDLQPQGLLDNTIDSLQEVNDHIDFEILWAEVEEAVRIRKPKAWPRYLGIIKMRASGWTVSEIAEAESVSIYRAASIMSEARRCLKGACEAGEILAGVV